MSGLCPRSFSSLPSGAVAGPEGATLGQSRSSINQYWPCTASTPPPLSFSAPTSLTFYVCRRTPNESTDLK